MSMEEQARIIRQQAIKECAELVMDWEHVDINMTAGQWILEKMGVQDDTEKSRTVA